MNKSVLNFADLFCFIAEMAHTSKDNEILETKIQSPG